MELILIVVIVTWVDSAILTGSVAVLDWSPCVHTTEQSSSVESFVVPSKGSGPRGGSRQVAAPKITVEEDHDDDEDREEPETEDGYVSDSSSTTSDDLAVIEEEHGR